MEGQAAFENGESTFPFTSCIRQGSAEARRLWLKMAKQILWNVEPEWKRKQRDSTLKNAKEENIKSAALCWRTTGRIQSHSKTHLDQMMTDFIQEAERWDLELKPASLRWRSTFADEKMDDIEIRAKTRLHKLPFEKKFTILGHILNQAMRHEVTCGGDDTETCFCGTIKIASGTKLPRSGQEESAGASKERGARQQRTRETS